MTEQLVNQKKSEKMSRRDFLKLLVPTTAGIVGTVMELEKGLISAMCRSFVDTMTDAALLDEGNPAQRVLVFEGICREADALPTMQKAQYVNSVLVPWLKLNVAERYAYLERFKLASRLAIHYMYGKGTLNVTDLFLDEVKQGRRSWTSSGEDMIGQRGGGNIVDDYIAYLLTERGERDLETVRELKWLLSPKEDFHKTLKSNIPTSLKYKRVVWNEPDFSNGLYYALNRFTLTVDGLATKISENPKDANIFTVKLAPGSLVTLFDVYDWKKLAYGTSGNLWEASVAFLESIGVKDAHQTFYKTLGSETASKISRALYQVHAEITNAEIAELAHHNINGRQIATPFEIGAKFRLKNPVSFDIAKKYV